MKEMGDVMKKKKKGRHVTLKYFSILIKLNRKLRLFIGPGQTISLTRGSVMCRYLTTNELI